MRQKQHGGGRRVSGRAVMIVVAAVVIFVIGAMVGGGWTKDRELTNQQNRIERCVPIVNAAQVQSCLDGTLQ